MKTRRSMASQPYTNWFQLSAAEAGCKTRLVLQIGSLETGSRRIIPNIPKVPDYFLDGTETEDGKEIELKPARGDSTRQAGTEERARQG